MKNKWTITEWVIFVSVAVLLALLLSLTVTMIYTISRSNLPTREETFDLDRLTAEKPAVPDEYTETLLPEFIGLTANGERRGISGSVNVMTDLYRAASVVLSDVLTAENAETPEDGENYWRSLADEPASVYIRYHSELPDCIIGLYADWISGRDHERNAVSSYVYELFLLPYSDVGRAVTAAVRSIDGTVTVYRLPSPDTPLSENDLFSLILSYRSSLSAFTFAGDRYSAASPTEPIMLDTLFAREMLITDGTSFLIRGNRDEQERLGRIFGLNMDKLLSTYDETGGVISYTDAQGGLYLLTSSFEYTAEAGEGLDTEKLLGYTGASGLDRMIRASLRIFTEIRAIGKNYTGGDAGICFDGIVSDGSTVTLTYRYTSDNIGITGLAPAYTVTFRDGVLVRAELNTVSAKRLAGRTELLHEWWFFEVLGGQNRLPLNVGLVYRCDFQAESIGAEWTAVFES